MLAVCALAAPPKVCAQASFEVMPTVEIPKEGYGSWSLFLICNPAWIIKNGDKGISGAPGEAGAVQPVKVRSGKGVAPAW
jgi:hypothetical protein